MPISSEITRRIIFSALSLFLLPASTCIVAAAGDTRPSAVAGRYSILRAEDKDTGCMLTLDDRSKGRGGFRAQLAPACRDNGIVVFDPVGWSIERGHLALTARKGHKAHFDLDSGGIWRRDSSEGKALSLKRL